MSLPIEKSAAKTVSLPLEKSAAKNVADADLEIGSQKLSLPIQKSTMMVESFRLYFSIFLVFTQ